MIYRIRKRILYSVLIALTAVASTGFSETVVLTWDAAWQTAQERNVAVLSSRESLEIARQQIREAWSGALPTVSLAGTYTRNLETPVIFFSGQAFPIGLDNTYFGQIELTQPLWVAGKVGIALKAAKSYRKQAWENSRQTLSDIRTALAQMYYGAILSRELLSTAELSLSRAVDHREQTRLLYEEGVVSEYDKIRAEVQVANLEPTVLEAENSYALALDNLRRLLNYAPEDSLVLTGKLELTDNSVPEVDWKDAVINRSEMTALHHQRDVSRYLLSITKRDLYYPSLYASLNYQTQTQSNNFKFEDYGWENSSAAMLTLSIPLFDGLATPARVRQGEANLRRLDYAEADLKNQIRTEVDNARRELGKALQVVSVQEANIREAQRGYEIAQVRYENGLGTQLELLDSELQLDRARVNRFQALYHAITARFELERAMGQHADAGESP